MAATAAELDGLGKLDMTVSEDAPALGAKLHRHIVRR